MIVSVSGKIESVGNGYIDILVSSGITYRVNSVSRFINSVIINDDKTSIEKSSECDQPEIKVYTSYQVREDSATLYGFGTQEERNFFEVLLSVSGVGPKTALNIIETYDLETLFDLIKSADYKTLSKVSGLGKKGSQKIVVELQGKIGEGQFEEMKLGRTYDEYNEIREALESLGYRGKELEGMLDKADKSFSAGDSDGEKVTVESVLQKILKEN